MPRLVLFDIDETMISSDGAGRRAISRALMDLFDVRPEQITVKMSGKTDPQILSEILRAAGMCNKEIAEKLDEMLKLYIGLLEEEIEKAGHYIIHDGVKEILEELSHHKETQLGLLTGNIEPGAKIKLKKFELNDYFPLGAYGSDSADRMDLPEIAHKRAVKHYKTEYLPRDIVIIGDSIYDVLCAKGYGAKSIAVNSGSTTKAELESVEPEFLFDSLSNTAKIMDAILA